MPEPESTFDRKPLKAEVYDVLHKNILAGQYAGGTWLRQQEIARQLGVSMTPVREALDLLVSNGLAERVAYRGVRVTQPSNPDILDAYEARLVIEPAATALAAARVSEEGLRRLRQLLAHEALLHQLRDLPNQRQVSRALHSAIVDGCGNLVLKRLYSDALRAFPDWMLYEHLFRHPELLESSLQSEHLEHSSIVEALGQHNVEAASKLALQHVLMRGRELEKYLGIPAESLRARERPGLYLIGAPHPELLQFHKEN